MSAAALNIQVIPVSQVPKTARPFDDSQLPLVLVVDDESLVADTVCAVLRKGGFAAIPAYGGRPALELARLIRPHVLLTDVAMPELDGVQLARTVSKELPDCKVLLFSGHMLARDLLAALNEGNGYELLSKPMNPADLIRKVSECIGLDSR